MRVRAVFSCRRAQVALARASSSSSLSANDVRPVRGLAALARVAVRQPGDEDEREANQADRYDRLDQAEDRPLHLVPVLCQVDERERRNQEPDTHGGPIAKRDHDEVGEAGNQTPDVQKDDGGRTDDRHVLVSDQDAQQEQHEERDRDQVRGLIDPAEDPGDAAELPPPEHLDLAHRLRRPGRRLDFRSGTARAYGLESASSSSSYGDGFL